MMTLKAIFLFGLYLLFIANSSAQQSHTEVVKSLYSRLAAQVPEASSVVIDSVAGLSTGITLNEEKPAARIDYPEVSYQKIADKKYTRSIRINYQLSDSSGTRGSSVVASDTMDIRILRKMRREAPADLRGGPISSTGKILRPLAVVAGSIGAVLLLFRLRTR